MTEPMTERPLAKTSRGRVAGLRRRTPDGAVDVFLGVPYADSGGKAGRFRTAAPAPAWDGTRDAATPAPTVPQNPDPVREMRGLPPETWAETGSLTANVWAPEGAHALPVMGWVHGGGYATGSNTSPLTDGARLAASANVVVVALSYRLGAFGFFPAAAELGDGFEDAGNLGLLDLVAGLEWVRDEASAFGGDARRVTLLGQSAGAAAVGSLLGMPRAEGLFGRAIMQSGTAERARSREANGEIADRFLRVAGLTSATAADMLGWEADRVLDVQRPFADEIAAETVGLPLPFQPVIDGRSLPMLPREAIRAGVNAHVDLIAGTNQNEGSFFTALAEPAQRTDAATSRMRERLLSQTRPGSDIRADDARYAELLAGIRGTPPAGGEVLESMLTDVQYRQPTNRLLDARRGASGRTFAYRFTWRSPAMGGILGSAHTLELPFVFRTLDGADAQMLAGDAPPASLSDAMSAVWGEFARTGAPTIPGVGPWPEYEPERRATVRWDETPAVDDAPLDDLRRYWSAEPGA